MKPKFTNILQKHVNISLALACTFLTCTWFLYDYYNYRNEIRELRLNYFDSQKNIIQEQVDRAISYINFHRNKAEERLRRELNIRITEADQIANHIYNKYHSTKSDAELKEMLRDTLFSIRWKSGNGYYFAFDIDGYSRVHPRDKPGTYILDLIDKADKPFIRNTINLALSEGEGYINYYFEKPPGSGVLDKKLTYFKLFKPFNWIIGSGNYLDDTTSEIQSLIKERLTDIRYSNGKGYIFVTDFRGNPLVSIDPSILNGTNLFDLTDINGVKIIQELIKASQKEEGGFVNYLWEKPNRNEISPKLSFARSIPDWQWCVGSGLYLDDIERDILLRTQSLERAYKYKLMIVATSVLLLMLFLRQLSRKQVKSVLADFSELATFFSNASNDSVIIKTETLQYSEFESLGQMANTMVAERAKAKQEVVTYQEHLEDLVRARTNELEYANESLSSINDRLRKIVETTRGLSVCSDIVQFGSTLLEEFSGHMRAAGGSLFLIEDDGLHLLYSREESQPPDFIPFPLPEGSILQQAIDQKSPLLIQDIAGKKTLATNEWPVQSEGSALVFQLRDDEELPIGLLALHNRVQPSFVEQDKEIGSILASFSCETLRVIRTMESLRSNEKRFRDLVRLLPEVVFETNREFELTFANQRAFELFGYTENELKHGLNCFEMLSSTDRDHAYKNLMRQLNFEDPGTVEYQAQRKDGSHFPILLHVSPITKGGNFEGLRGIIVDITERKVAEEEKTLIQEQYRQAQKMEAIGTLAGGIAHDFNNILSAIMGYTELASLSIPREHKIAKNLDEVLKASVRAKDLVKQILTFSRQHEERREFLQIHHVVKEALKLLRSSIPTTIEFNEIIDEAGGYVKADATQIHQIVMNLCTNAYHAMLERGGVLTVELSEVTINSADNNFSIMNQLRPGNYMLLKVSDTGTGIDQKILERIFDPYFTTKPTGQGTGMGLALIHGIVKSYKGSITVNSVPGEGTTFKIYLPCHEIKMGPLETVTEHSIPKGDERILLIDDEETIVRMEQDMLKSLGYRITSFNNCEEAFKVFSSQPDAFEIVITDLTMPHMTGIEFSQKVLAIKPDLPIILCTGFSDVMTREKARAVGIKELIMKPISRLEFGTVVRKVLDA